MPSFKSTLMAGSAILLAALPQAHAAPTVVGWVARRHFRREIAGTNAAAIEAADAACHAGIGQASWIHDAKSNTMVGFDLPKSCAEYAQANAHQWGADAPKVVGPSTLVFPNITPDIKLGFDKALAELTH